MDLILVLAVTIQFASGVVFAKVVPRWASWGNPDYPSAEMLAGSLQVLSTALYLVVAAGGWAYWIIPVIVAGLLIGIPNKWWKYLSFAVRCMLKLEGGQRFKLCKWKPNEPCEVRSESKEPWRPAKVLSDEARERSLAVLIEDGTQDGTKFQVRSPDLIRERP